MEILRNGIQTLPNQFYLLEILQKYVIQIELYSLESKLHFTLCQHINLIISFGVNALGKVGYDTMTLPSF